MHGHELSLESILVFIDLPHVLAHELFNIQIFITSALGGVPLLAALRSVSTVSG